MQKQNPALNNSPPESCPPLSSPVPELWNYHFQLMFERLVVDMFCWLASSKHCTTLQACKQNLPIRHSRPRALQMFMVRLLLRVALQGSESLCCNGCEVYGGRGGVLFVSIDSTSRPHNLALSHEVESIHTTVCVNKLLCGLAVD